MTPASGPAYVAAVLMFYLDLPDTPLRPSPQDQSLASHARRLRKTDGNVVWKNSAARIHRLQRALQPWPGLFTHYVKPGGQPLRARVRVSVRLPGVIPGRAQVVVRLVGVAAQAHHVSVRAGQWNVGLNGAPPRWMDVKFAGPSAE